MIRWGSLLLCCFYCLLTKTWVSSFLLLASWNILTCKNWEVSGQFCAFDFNNYDKSGNYSLTDFSHWWSWISCQDSYVIDTSQTKFISIRASFTQINCQTNNLILTDSTGKQRFDFCNGTGRSRFTFTTRNVAWIKMERVRKCSFFSCHAPQTFSFELKYSDEPPVSWLPDQCGVPAIPPVLPELRIINGVDAVANSWPWQAFVLTLKIDPWNKGYVKQYVCGASLISGQVCFALLFANDYLSTCFLSIDKKDLNIQSEVEKMN